MNFTRKYFWQLIVVFLLGIIFFQNDDSSSNDRNIIITKPKIGNFDKVKPEEIKNNSEILYITIKGDTIKLENPINKKLAEKYQKETDSLKKELLYFQAIQQRKYKQTFEDKNLKADIYAETTGTLDSIKLDYLIKSDTIKLKQPVFSLLGGLSLESNINTLKPSLKANIGFQNRRKDIFLLGGNKSEVTVTYLKNIFTIKK